MTRRRTPHPASLSSSGKQTHNHSHQHQQNAGRNSTGEGSSMSRSGHAPASSRSTVQGVLNFLSPWKISLVTWSLRCMHVLNRDNWWLVHPDEVYQSVEIGHIEAYGYGFRSYEFSPPGVSANDTRYHQILMDAGLGALRSPIFPYFYTLAYFLAFQLGVRCNPFLISRLAHVCVTSLLPVSAYYFTNRLFRSRGAAMLAAILTASSVHLNVYGTRCLIQSFLSPVTIFTCSLILTITDAQKHKDTGDNCHSQLSNGWKKADQKHSNHEQTITTSKLPASNEFGTSAKNANHNGVANHRISDAQKVHNNKQLNGHSVSPLKQNGFIDASTSVPNLRNECLAVGFLMGLTCYVRPDVVLIHAINFLVLLSWKRKKRLCAFVSIILLGIVFSFLLGMLFDRLYYNGWVISPYNWVKANVVLDFSTGIFGKMSPGFYVKNILLQDCLTFLLCQICVIVIIGVYFAKQKQLMKREPTDDEHGEEISLQQSFRLLLGWILSLLFFSFHGHKEVRFIHDTIVLVLVFASGVVDLAIDHISTRFRRIKKERVQLGTIVVLLLLQWRQHPGPGDSRVWAYQGKEGSHSINTCLEFVSLQKDARGVFLDSSLFMTGGMSILHHDIPVLSLLLDGFYEFGFESRLNFTSTNALLPLNKKYSNQPNIVNDRPRGISQYSVNTFTRASNYVSQANAPAVVRIIFENKNYNYLILRQNRRFVDKGFEKVFQTGSHRVLKRTFEATSEMQLSSVLKRIPLGTNATVLLHEGDVLSYMGRYKEAVERFQACLAIQPSLVGAYLPLHTGLLKLGLKQEASRVLSSCYKLASKEKCTAVRPLTRVN